MRLLYCCRVTHNIFPENLQNEAISSWLWVVGLASWVTWPSLAARGFSAEPLAPNFIKIAGCQEPLGYS